MGPGRKGKGRKLMHESARAEDARMGSLAVQGEHSRCRFWRRERGQVMVEFALIAPLFLTIVIGIIQFGLALNYWLDIQRISNQGARWAVVNSWPACPRSSANTLAPHPGDGCNGAAASPNTLQQYLFEEHGSSGENPTIGICFPSGTSEIGDPVRVIVAQPFRLLALVPSPKIILKAQATMRLEQEPGRYAANLTQAQCG